MEHCTAIKNKVDYIDVEMVTIQNDVKNYDPLYINYIHLFESHSMYRKCLEGYTISK